MTPEYFISLSDQRREAILAKKGTYLAQLEKGELLYDLYQVDSFYVEFCYFISANSTVTTRVFTEVESLTPYLENCKIEELIKTSQVA